MQRLCTDTLVKSRGRGNVPCNMVGVITYTGNEMIDVKWRMLGPLSHPFSGNRFRYKIKTFNYYNTIISVGEVPGIE